MRNVRGEGRGSEEREGGGGEEVRNARGRVK